MTAKKLFFVVIAAAVYLAPAAVSHAVTDASLNWKTISTEHFNVHYHDGAEWTAEQVASIAEEIFPHITGLYNCDPGIVDFIIKDTQDFANGAAYYYDNKVEIWATNLEFGLRGTTVWLRNVITHEYTHIVSIQAAMKMPKRIPALYFQMIGFENEKRPDVLTGYPNVIASYPFAGVVMPPWYAEGVSQYQSPTKQTDCWDTHRDMILRTAILDGKMLSYDQMCHFGHGSLGNEQVYDHGYGLVSYIALTYGPEAVESVTRGLQKFSRLTIDGALEEVTGKDGSELYDDWCGYLRTRADDLLESVRANPREGVIIAGEGNMTTAPSFSPDGSKITFLSNKGSEYAATSLYVADRDGTNLKELVPRVSSRPVFSPDGRKILYARHRRASLYNAMKSDLHTYDLEKKDEKRLTKKLRASQPGYYSSVDNDSIVFVLNSDGTHKLAVMGAGGEGLLVLYERGKGTQFYHPQYSPDGTKILFGIFEKGTRHIAVIDNDGSNFRYLVRTQNDERDARWLPDGTGIVFASDRTGIFNIYKKELATPRYEQLTNVVGGAFFPDISPADGSLVYAGYNGDGYHVAVLDGALDTPVAEFDEIAYFERTMGELDDCADLKKWDGSPVVNFDADRSGTASTIVPLGDAKSGAAGPREYATTAAGTTGTYEKRDYEWTYSDLQFFPRLVIWDGTPRFGAFIAGSEILDKQLFFLGGSYGVDGRFDAFIDFELRHLFPVIYMEFIRMREITSDFVELEDDPDFDALDMEEIRYDLWAADLGVRFEFNDPYSITNRNDMAVWYSRGEYRIHLDWKGIDNGVKTTLPPVAWRYFIGSDLYYRWRYKSIKVATDADINPRGGREFNLQYMHSWDKLFVSGFFQYGLRPDFTTFEFDQFTFDWREYIGMPWLRHSLELRAYGSFISDAVDDFFWVYMGGMDGIRGYTFYSIGERRGMGLCGTYRFPIARRIGKPFSWLTLRDIYGGVFFEAANAWGTHIYKDETKTSVGAELRVKLGSWYMYPTAINFVAARGLDDATFKLPATGFEVVHDPQWHYYLSVGFTY